MYKRQLLELIRVNLLYVNPQLTNKAREKGKKGKRLTIYLLSQNLFSGLIFFTDLRICYVCYELC